MLSLLGDAHMCQGEEGLGSVRLGGCGDQAQADKVYTERFDSYQETPEAGDGTRTR